MDFSLANNVSSGMFTPQTAAIIEINVATGRILYAKSSSPDIQGSFLVLMH